MTVPAGVHVLIEVQARCMTYQEMLDLKRLIRTWSDDAVQALQRSAELRLAGLTDTDTDEVHAEQNEILEVASRELSRRIPAQIYGIKKEAN